jgi:hypothetical protein
MNKTLLYKIENGSLHLRKLGLSQAELLDLIETLKDALQDDAKQLTSFSLSYNDELGDAGVSALVEHLSSDLTSLGLVGCSITDAGAVKLLDWVKSSTKLQMLCIEDNNFSPETIHALLRLSQEKSFSFFA